MLAKIEGLYSLDVPFDLPCNDGKDFAATTVFAVFHQFQDASQFIKAINDRLKLHELLKIDYPIEDQGDITSYKVKLSIPLDYINQGERADSIIAYLKNNFQLPKCFTIFYQDKLSNKWVAEVEIEYADKLNAPLSEFLPSVRYQRDKGIDGLDSITFSYDLGTNLDTIQEAESVSLLFNNELSANFFYRSVRPSLKEQQIFKAELPCSVNSESATKYKVRLFLGLELTNKGSRAGCILTYLQQHYKLPNNIFVEYPRLGKPMPKSSLATVSLPLNKAEVLNNNLTDFLKVLINETVKNITKLTQITCEISEIPTDPSFLKVKCKDTSDMNTLKENLLRSIRATNANIFFKDMTDVCGQKHTLSSTLVTNKHFYNQIELLVDANNKIEYLPSYNIIQ